MDIDLSALRGLESEKDISVELAIKAIEDALLVAYHRSGGSAVTARVEVDRGSGHVTVWAAETGEEGEVLREYDDTPAGFGRPPNLKQPPQGGSEGSPKGSRKVDRREAERTLQGEIEGWERTPQGERDRSGQEDPF
jgi:hypothetical protein